MPFLLQDVALNPKLNLEDGKHPNRDGVKVIAKNLTPYLVKQLKNKFKSRRKFYISYLFQEQAVDIMLSHFALYMDP